MASSILILSQNDQHHPLEELGDLMLEWIEPLEGITADIHHDKQILAASELDSYDVCILCTTVSELTDAQEKGIVSFVQGGKTAIGIHSATVVNPQHESFIELIGGRFIHHSPFHEFPVKVELRDHPITQGVEDFSITDELYVLDRVPADAQVLATAYWEEAHQPMLYVKKHGNGKVLYNALGHNQKAYQHPSFQQLVVQGIQWACEG